MIWARSLKNVEASIESCVKGSNNDHLIDLLNKILRKTKSDYVYKTH